MNRPNDVSPTIPPPPKSPTELAYSQVLIAQIMAEHRRLCLLSYAALATEAALIAYELEIGGHLLDLARDFGMSAELQRQVVGEIAAEVMGLNDKE